VERWFHPTTPPSAALTDARFGDSLAPSSTLAERVLESPATQCGAFFLQANISTHSDLFIVTKVLFCVSDQSFQNGQLFLGALKPLLRGVCHGAGF
jgi:hypothetical protein